jgi:hypothetical protein
MRASIFFRLGILCAGLLSVVACTSMGSKSGIERADDLGLEPGQGQLQSLPSLPPLPPSSATEIQTEIQARAYRDAFVEQWMARSDLLCREYKDKIIQVSRNTKFATDATSTILSGLATIFTALGTIHPLTGAATIVSGVGAAAQTDTFEQQSGEIIASAIQTARERQATQIEYNLQNNDTLKYNIYRAQRDVIDYHNMCSLETAMSQVRSSLNANSPYSGQAPPAAQALQVAPAVARPESVVPVGVQPPAPPAAPENPPPPAPHSVTGPPIPLAPPTVGIIDAISPAEKAMTPEEGRRVQAALCLPPDPGPVTFGPQTRAAISIFRTVPGHTGHLGPTDGLTKVEANFLKRAPSCDTSQFANPFEYFEYQTDNRETSAEKIRKLQAMLHANVPDGKTPAPDTGKFDEDTRTAIGDIQEANHLPTRTKQVTRAFLNLLVKSPQ